MSADGGGNSIVKNRFKRFLVWQSIQSAAIFILSKVFLLSPFTTNPKFTPSFFSVILFVLFIFSILLFSTSLFLVSSPQQFDRPASPFELSFGLIRFLVLSGGQPLSLEFRRRARICMGFVLYVAAAAFSSCLSVICICLSCDSFESGFIQLGFKGLAVGLFYGLLYVYKKRWALEFPIIQRPLFFSFKMRIPLAISQALKYSCGGCFFSAALALFLPNEYKTHVSMGKFITEQIIFCIGILVVLLCWELSHHLHQVLHTKRFTFAPPKGSAAAETNPTEPLLAALEESTTKSLLQYLAYLDLCMVCESNADSWRRAAFFEETGETYKRVLAVCLRPLEQFTLRLGEALESSSDNASQVSHQLNLPTEQVSESKLQQAFFDIQLCAWCARVVASLTVHSRREDRFGVAQLSGSNAAVVSTLISCLLAVETCMGKKTNLQSPNNLMGSAGIKWATISTGRRDLAAGITGKRKDNPLYSKAYSMADIMRTSIYHIVSTFHNEMLDSCKAGVLDKDWIVTSKPLYGTRELLLQKLNLLLDFRAS